MFHLDHSQASTLCLTALSGLVLVFAKRVFKHIKNVQKKYPPGPKGVPIFGNLFRLFDTTTPSWNDFAQWGKQYGDIVYVDAFGQGMLLLNSHKAAVDLLDRRGGNYSDRPHFIIVGEILTRGLLLGPAHDGELWRKMRRAGHEAMSKATASKYHQMQQREALVFTENLLRDSKGWYQEVYRTTASSLLSAVYDLPPTLSREDPVIAKLDDFEKYLMRAVFPGNYLVEFLPWMKYLPSAISPWKKEAEARYEEFSDFFMKMFRDVQRQMNEGDEKPGMVGHTIRQQERLGLDDTEASWVPAGFANGAIGNAETLLWFFAIMVAYPDKQTKCQEELDAIVGRSRMPTFEDRDNLPYVKATVMELLRWIPTAPIGAQHVTKQDDWYEGYFIPKGTHCFAHIWALNRDPTIYGPDADNFNPGRFIDKNGELLPAVADTKDGHVTYGFGPRLCPGRHFSNDILFITFARLLWAATISPAIDEKTGNPIIPHSLATGNPVLPDLMATVGDGLTVRPQPFDCIIKPRFAEAEEMVSRTKELLE